uniref:Uncharacterized protein n=1 Tax=Cacopsylla melanoneura TaxID=428564 RepID=A0A8D9ENV4_9HEMI
MTSFSSTTSSCCGQLFGDPFSHSGPGSWDLWDIGTITCSELPTLLSTSDDAWLGPATGCTVSESTPDDAWLGPAAGCTVSESDCLGTAISSLYTLCTGLTTIPCAVRTFTTRT